MGVPNQTFTGPAPIYHGPRGGHSSAGKEGPALMGNASCGILMASTIKNGLKEYDLCGVLKASAIRKSDRGFSFLLDKSLWVNFNPEINK